MHTHTCVVTSVKGCTCTSPTRTLYLHIRASPFEWIILRQEGHEYGRGSGHQLEYGIYGLMDVALTHSGAVRRDPQLFNEYDQSALQVEGLSRYEVGEVVNVQLHNVRFPVVPGEPLCSDVMMMSQLL